MAVNTRPANRGGNVEDLNTNVFVGGFSYWEGVHERQYIIDMRQEALQDLEAFKLKSHPKDLLTSGE